MVRVLLRGLLIVAVFAFSYWVLGAFAFLRIRGLPQTVRWCISALLALGAGGLVPLAR